MLKRNLAPIEKAVWSEVDETAKGVLEAFLTTRRALKVNGPKGLDYTVVPEGRLAEIQEEEGLCYGAYKVQPLLEARAEFEMNRWELDNLLRGAKDIDYTSLEEAAKKMALFEEKILLHGSDDGLVTGLVGAAEKNLAFGADADEVMAQVTEGVLALRDAYAGGPYALIVGKELYKKIQMMGKGYPLRKRLENLLGMAPLYSHAIEGAVLVPYKHEDLELTIGQDLAVGYQSSDNEKVKFFITESFTLRVLDPALIVTFDA